MLKINKTWYLLLVGLVIFVAQNSYAQENEMVKVKGGTYIPLYGSADEPVVVDPFLMDVYPVTNAEYLEFVKKNPEWQQSNIKRLFADDAYLNTWKDNTDFGELNPDAPVTNISWFAAKSYCESQNKRLATMDEWEFAAMADEEFPDARQIESYNRYILKWYETPKTYNNSVGSTYKNYWGIYDLQGLIWEWTSDFNSVFMSGESRKDSDINSSMFCGAAAIGATDLKDYASFMRYAFRGSLKARFTGRNLGFRCAKDY